MLSASASLAPKAPLQLHALSNVAHSSCLDFNTYMACFTTTLFDRKCTGLSCCLMGSLVALRLMGWGLLQP